MLINQNNETCLIDITSKDIKEIWLDDYIMYGPGQHEVIFEINLSTTFTRDKEKIRKLEFDDIRVGIDVYTTILRKRGYTIAEVNRVQNKLVNKYQDEINYLNNEENS